jgi:hypothetical protein
MHGRPAAARREGWEDQRRLRRARRLASGAALLLAAVPAAAEPAANASTPVPLGYRLPASDWLDGLDWTVELAGAGAGFGTWNTAFGAGRVDARSGRDTGDASWFEGYLKPSSRASFGGRGFGTLYGALVGLGTLTRGDGDAAGFTDGGDGDLALETAFAGWNSGDLLGGPNSVDVSYGRQELHIGDSFLIDDGDYDAGHDGAYWLTPRRAFPRAAVLRLGSSPALGTRPGFALERGGDTKPLRGDVFYLEGDRDRDHAELVGVNLELASAARLGRFENPYWGAQEDGRLGATFLHVLAANDKASIRSDMNVLHVWASNVRIVEGLPHAPDLYAWGGYAREWGGDHGHADAEAWYLEGALVFTRLLPGWHPMLRYRYSRFSGDDDPDDRTQKAFDPLFYGFNYNRGVFYGTWFQGEIAGEYLLFNSNQRTHSVTLTLWPEGSGLESGELALGLAFYDFSLDERFYRGVAVSSRSFAREVDAYAVWRPRIHPKLSLELSPVFGVAWPGGAARDFFGHGEPYYLLEAYASFVF